MSNFVYVKEVDEKTNFNLLFSELLEQNNFFPTEEDLVLIKPNLCDLTSASEGSTTDVKLVRYLIQEIQKKSNCKIVVVESDHPISDADREFEILGYKELEKELDIELVNLSKDKIVEVSIDGHYFDTLKVGETSLKATKIINFAKMKTHASQKITICLKNLFGLIPQKFRKEFHPYMNQIHYDLDNTFQTNLCIVDGLVGMEDFGPSDGFAKQSNLIISGTNNTCVDIVCSKIMGFRMKSVPVLKYMTKLNNSLKDVRINLQKKLDKKYKRNFKFIPWYTHYLKNLGFKLIRFGNKISDKLSSLGSFSSEAGTGFLVLLKGSFSSLSSGKLSRKDAIRYAIGLLRKPIKRMKYS
ncbi:MAG: DUF362 domain-containing protein [Candidatus Heimdallarchaeota archaeon]|nr:DUF362 domain-containing protein [Candidatus Heimdallarchaeota archaeon]